MLCDLFPPTSSPRKGGPAARASMLSFLEEVSNSALKTYTPAQLSTILSQRAHVRFPSPSLLPPAPNPSKLLTDSNRS